MREIKVGKIYRHFKGNLYLVLDIVNDATSKKTENFEKALYGDGLKWARSYDEFNSEVDHEKYPNVNQKYRYEEVDDIYAK